MDAKYRRVNARSMKMNSKCNQPKKKREKKKLPVADKKKMK